MWLTSMQVGASACLRRVQSAVASLGLPTTVTNPGSVYPGQVDGAIAVDPASISGDPQKFSMGVTLPTVPARLVK